MKRVREALDDRRPELLLAVTHERQGVSSTQEVKPNDKPPGQSAHVPRTAQSTSPKASDKPCELPTVDDMVAVSDNHIPN